MMNEWILSSSILIAAVVAVRFLLRGRFSRRRRCARWAVVLVRLLLPVQLFTSDFGTGSVARRVDLSESVRQVYASANEERYEQEYDAAYQQAVAVYEAASQSYDPVVVEREAQTVARQRMELDMNKLLLGVWFAGMVVMTSVIVSCNVHLGLQLRRSRREYPADYSLLPVYVTEAVPTPCIFGLFRPAIYLTAEAVGDKQMCDHVLIHEQTHYRHGDHIWSVLRGICLVLHWYNPLVWLAARISRADAELACDEGVLKQLGENHRGDYGRTLIGLTCANRVDSMFIAATTMTGSTGSIRERIKLLMKRPRNTVLTLTVMLLMLTLIVGCTFAGAPNDTIQTPPGTTAPETTVPETTAPETTVPETTAPETTAPETTAPETTAPETTAPMETVVIPAAPETITEESWQKNHLYAFDPEVYGIEDGAKAAERPVLGSGYKRNQIKTVTFLDSLADAPATAWYVGIEGREDHVLAWVEPNGELYDLYIGAWGGINGRDYSAYLFAGYENLEAVSFGGAFHTEWCGEFVRMFLGCEKLHTVDIENLNSYNVHSMESMFEGCRSLTEVNAGALDNTHLIITSEMFKRCDSLTELDLSGWDADELFRTDEMFYGCTSLTKLDLSGLDTSEVVNMNAMFHSCRALESLDLSGFDTGEVEYMWGVFAFCESLKELDLTGWDTRKVVDMNSMFLKCGSLTGEAVSQLDTSSVYDIGYMFYECPGITVEDVQHFNMESVHYWQHFMDGDQWKNLFE